MASLHENSNAWERGFVKKEKDTKFGNDRAQVLQPVFHAIAVRCQLVHFMLSSVNSDSLRKTSIGSSVMSCLS